MSLRKVSVLIISSNQDFLSLCGQMLDDRGLHTTLAPADPSEVPDFAARLKPDIILSDLWFHGMDVLELIPLVNGAFEKEPPKWIIMFSGEDHAMLRTGLPKQVSYIIEKPFDADLLADRIYRLAEYREGEVRRLTREEESIADLLRQLSVPGHMAGFYYLASAIDLAANDSKLLNSIIRGLYPKVADRFGTTVASVEKAIRSVVSVCWSNCDQAILRQIFGYQGSKRKPTSSAFIAVLSDRVRIERSIQSKQQNTKIAE